MTLMPTKLVQIWLGSWLVSYFGRFLKNMSDALGDETSRTMKTTTRARRVATEPITR